MKTKHPVIDPFKCPECGSNEVFCDTSDIEGLERTEEDHCSKCECEFKITWTATKIHIKKFVPHTVIMPPEPHIIKEE